MSVTPLTGIRRKGEPVWVLMAIMGGWVGVRAATWDMTTMPVEDSAAVPHIAAHHERGHTGRTHAGGAASTGYGEMRRGAALRYASAVVGRGASPLVARDGAASLAGVYRLIWLASDGQGDPAHRILLPRTGPGEGLVTGDRGVLSAARAPVSLADPRAALLFDAPAGPVRMAGVLPRWSADGWVLWRQGGGGAASGSVLLPSYGANQAGAVLRYRLAPASPYRPAVYGRAYAALNGTGEREVAAGVSVRPVPAVPVIAMAEARASHFAGGSTHLRPAVALVTELAPVALPGALRGETYVQAGYVGGTGSTLFIDGQFRLERVARRGAHTELRLGGGAWGGAQTGAGRLDVGPTATVAFRTARMGAHLSLDWRLRVAGHASPGSGPAITLAAGF